MRGWIALDRGQALIERARRPRIGRPCRDPNGLTDDITRHTFSKELGDQSLCASTVMIGLANNHA